MNVHTLPNGIFLVDAERQVVRVPDRKILAPGDTLTMRSIDPIPLTSFVP